MSGIHGVDCSISVEPPGSSGLTHFPAHYHISGRAEWVYSYTICQTLPFIQWLPLPLTLLKPSFQEIENEVEFRAGISSITEYHFGGINVEVSFRRMKCHTGVLSSFYNGLHRKTPPERVSFSGFRSAWKKRDFTCWSIWKGSRTSVSFGQEPIPGPSNFHELGSDGVFMDQFIFRTVLARILNIC